MAKLFNSVSKNLEKNREAGKCDSVKKMDKNVKPVRGKQKIHFEYNFSTPNVDPYSEVKWEKRDVIMKNWKTGETTFEQRGVEFPDFWSVNATNIVTSKYFRGALGTDEREYSLRDLIDRVVNKYVKQGIIDEIFAEKTDAKIFANELKYMLLHQIFSFNSPVWFNVGTDSPQQVSACFILGVEDNMDSILNWYVEEGRIFKRGSGAGVNLSRIRAQKEGLSNGGYASGPVSFMRGADASAGTIASGGATRRAAKMVVLDVDHPDIEMFINTKKHEEGKIRALMDAGYDMGLDGKDIYSVQYQNANNSVRVSDEFMNAVEKGEKFGLRARLSGEVIEKVDAKKLFREIAEAAWACADPGLQYDDTINAWHTIPNEGKITASNPCSEYMSIDNSSCNLASINLLKFLKDNGKFDVQNFEKAVEIIFTAMDLSVSFGDFPTEKISENTRKFRQLGIGYANLGALLMAIGLPYDSPEGRNVAAAITSLMSATAYRRSAELAEATEPFGLDNGETFAKNAEAMTTVMKNHAKASKYLTDKIVDINHRTNAEEIIFAANREWENVLKLGGKFGWRNSQASLLAPTGTIGFMMDCDTTGIEPDFSLIKFKKMVDGTSMQIVNNTIPRALKKLNYTKSEISEITKHILKNGNVIGSKLREEDYAIFDTAVGERAIKPMGHVRMMAAVQPFLSGAISKTVNMPETATIDEVAEVYMDSWKLGLKAVAIYRDNCKAYQPLSDAKASEKSDKDLAKNDNEKRENCKVCENCKKSIDKSDIKKSRAVAENVSIQTSEISKKFIDKNDDNIEKIEIDSENQMNFINEESDEKREYNNENDSEKLNDTKQNFAKTDSENVKKVREIMNGVSAEKSGKNADKYMDNKIDETFENANFANESLQPKLFDDQVMRGTKISLPSIRDSKTYKYEINGMSPLKGYITTGKYDNGKLGEVFLKVSKQGSTLAGLMDAFSIAVSMGLQYGVPLEKFVEKFANMRFEPSGMTGDNEIPNATSPLDYIFRRLALDNLSFDQRSAYGIYTTRERAYAVQNGGFYEELTDEQQSYGDRQISRKSDEASADFAKIEREKAEFASLESTKTEKITTDKNIQKTLDKSDEEARSTAELMEKMGVGDDAPICMSCGVKMRPAGSCYICELCGSTSGCS